MSTDRSVSAVEKFTMKWCPLGKTGEFLADLQALIAVSVSEAVEYITQAGTAAGTK